MKLNDVKRILNIEIELDELTDYYKALDDAITEMVDSKSKDIIISLYQMFGYLIEEVGDYFT